MTNGQSACAHDFRFIRWVWSLLGHRPFLLYFSARGFSEFSYQIAAVAVGWQAMR
jgi:hypothetical protein